jgi:glycerate dehydrogenase
MSNIVILDAFPTNNGDLSWDNLAQLGNLTIYERTKHIEEEIVQKCQNMDVVLTNKVPFTRSTFEKLPQLKLIAIQATGYNIIDIAAANDHNVIVCNVPGYSTNSVAQHTFALMLEIFSSVGMQSKAVFDGRWTTSPDFSVIVKGMHDLAGKVLGIYGFGAIGQAVAKIAKAFNMEVIYYSRTPKETNLAKYVSLEELFKASDVLSLHAPFNLESAKVVNKDRLLTMKKSAVLINTARGGLVDSSDLAWALNNDIISYAGIDTLEVEPPPPNHPLLTAKNCYLTPHVAWATFEARSRLVDALVNNVDCFLKGKPINVVNNL